MHAFRAVGVDAKKSFRPAHHFSYSAGLARLRTQVATGPKVPASLATDSPEDNDKWSALKTHFPVHIDAVINHQSGSSKLFGGCIAG